MAVERTAPTAALPSTARAMRAVPAFPKPPHSSMAVMPWSTTDLKPTDRRLIGGQSILAGFSWHRLRTQIGGRRQRPRWPPE
jgi:hypothetical protein